jgi:hypothetical protein
MTSSLDPTQILAAEYAALREIVERIADTQGALGAYDAWVASADSEFEEPLDRESLEEDAEEAIAAAVAWHAARREVGR